MPVALVARVFDTQEGQQFEVTFERFPVRIGRNPLNDLPIDRPYVSAFHAAIEVRDRQIFFRDLGSTNGTMFRGHKMDRDQPVDVTASPEIHIGPIVLRIALIEQAATKRDAAQEGNLLDIDERTARPGAPIARPNPIPQGGEDPFIRQLIPYLEAHRAAWNAAYRVIYDHLRRLPPELRTNYIKRLGLEHPSVNLETDFQKIAQYYGVDPRTLGELTPPHAALAALNELLRTLVPGCKPLEDVPSILAFARRLRDTLEVFLKCFVPLRDGYQEFTVGILKRDRDSAEGDWVATAKDPKELGAVLFGPSGRPEAVRQLYEIFVEVMSYQVALLNGVMVGVKNLVHQLSPKAIEEEFEKKGKKAGLLSSKWEALWKSYEDRHGDYSGEDKHLFETIFGPEFWRAYTATAGEDIRFALTPNQQPKR
jgi:type VI secretion system protein ImpI